MIPARAATMMRQRNFCLRLAAHGREDSVSVQD
jgi:hypothetical protein